MKRFSYILFTAVVLLFIENAFTVTVWAEATAATSPANEAAIQEEPAEKNLLHIEAPSSLLTNSANEIA